MSTAADLPLEDRARLLTGADFWTTAAAPGVPSIVLTDGPHGVRRQVGESDHLGLNAAAPATCFPPAVAVGSSWNPDLARRIGGAVAAEARALGVAVVLGPGVNIKRHPLCGRNFEYYSEDPLLAGALGSAQVQGLQDGGAGASVKHFALNNQETERMRVSVDADPRTVREIYLPAFERIVTDASPATVMCSYNRIDGVHASENSWLLTTVLRDEWGYDGLVVSDWGAVHDPVAAVRAGLDLEMPHGPHSTARIVAAVRSGELDEAVVTRAAQRVIDLTRWAPSDDEPAPDLDAHHALAREAAAECAVLLRNENAALPLGAAAGTVAVIGELARTPRYQGGGSSHINATRVDVPLDEIAARGSDLGVAVEFAAGYGIGDDADDAALRDEAVAAAARSGVAVVFAGLTEAEESEGFDRPDLAIDPQQVELLRAVAAAAPRTVVVLVGGGVIELETLARRGGRDPGGVPSRPGRRRRDRRPAVRARGTVGPARGDDPAPPRGDAGLRELPRRAGLRALRRGSPRRLPLVHHPEDRAAVPVRARTRLHLVHDRGPRRRGHRRRHRDRLGAGHQHRRPLRQPRGPAVRRRRARLRVPPATVAGGLPQGRARPRRLDHRRARPAAPGLRPLGYAARRLGRLAR